VVSVQALRPNCGSQEIRQIYVTAQPEKRAVCLSIRIGSKRSLAKHTSKGFKGSGKMVIVLDLEIWKCGGGRENTIM
jgi:hypothetical protein